MSGPVGLGAVEIAESIRAGRLSAIETLEAHLARLEERNPELNAVVTLCVDDARRAARDADAALARGEQPGPLHGVPMTVKDAFETAGVRTTFGSPNLSRHVPAEDATAVARLRAAGAIIFGKTNVPLLCYDWQCRHPKFGRTNNPWDTTRTPGGSSGGAAAALAAGITPLEIGSDIAGSIRVPCHFCGVAGIRPTEGSVSGAGAAAGPGYPRTFRNLFAVGPMARCVRDLQVALAIVRGPDRRDWAVPPVPFDGARDAHLRGTRIAVTGVLGGVPVDRETAVTIASLTASLRKAGAIVEEVEAPVDMNDALDVWGRIQGHESCALLPWPLRAAPLRWMAQLGPMRAAFGPGAFATGLGRGGAAGARGYFEALTRRDAIVGAFDAFLTKWDLWITAAAATPAFTHRRIGAPIDVDGRKVPYGMAMGVYACPTALAGNPIVVIPIGRTAGGLPIGVQLHGRRWGDDRLLALAEAIETLVQAP